MAFTNFKSDNKTRLDDKTEAKRAADLAWVQLCRDVDLRDAYRCRACGRRIVKTLRVQPDRAEHHHVIPESLSGPTTLENVCLLCLSCHQDRHIKRTLKISGNANGLLTFERDGKTWRA
jgi:hypothetical protein